MARHQIIYDIGDAAGNAVPGATIHVKKIDGTDATVYSGATGATVQTGSPYLTADSAGVCRGYVDRGVYVFQFGGGVSRPDERYEAATAGDGELDAAWASARPLPLVGTLYDAYDKYGGEGQLYRATTNGAGTPTFSWKRVGSRTIRGRVDVDGTIAAGTGFTVSKGAYQSGLYTVTFTNPFDNVPVITGATIFSNMAGNGTSNATFFEIAGSIGGGGVPTAGMFKVIISLAYNAQQDSGFHFAATEA